MNKVVIVIGPIFELQGSQTLDNEFLVRERVLDWFAPIINDFAGFGRLEEDLD